MVNNNSSGNQSKRGFDRVYGGTQTEQAREMWTFSKVNFARIAEDMGAVGIRVEKPAEIAGRSTQALKAEPPGDHRRCHRDRRAGAAGGDVREGVRASDPRENTASGQPTTNLRPTALSKVALAACSETAHVWSPTTPSAATPPQD